VPWWTVLLAVIGLILLVAIFDVTQRKHAVWRNFPVVGHFRKMFETIGPELRQYIVASNDEERPFNRDQRRWVYATAKKENPYFGFGTDSHQDTPGFPLIGHSAFPHTDPIGTEAKIPALKVLGEWRNRELAFRPASVVNISGMSFGSLSGPAIVALNRGAEIANCMHNTGEGGISEHHLHGGSLMYQVGTGYFGARADDGRFSMDRLLETIDGRPVQAIELKLSQGAKAGLGGLLPAAKVTAEIAQARGVPEGVAVESPARHHAFDDVAGLVNFVEEIAAATRLPVGIKSAVGQRAFWTELAAHMASTGRGPDFIAVDGGEGGTGAAPLVFSDHISLPFRLGFARAYAAFANEDLHRDVFFIGAGKLGLPAAATVAFGMGVDALAVGREAMLAAGCIQAQKCHTGHCPTGVATQSQWYARGLDPTSKGDRVGNYVIGLRTELLKVAHATGTCHPALIEPDSIELALGNQDIAPLFDVHRMDPAWRTFTPTAIADAESIMKHR
jgi:glutamate synthase domain-containing protein 2